MRTSPGELPQPRALPEPRALSGGRGCGSAAVRAAGPARGLRRSLPAPGGPRSPDRSPAGRAGPAAAGPPCAHPRAGTQRLGGSRGAVRAASAGAPASRVGAHGFPGGDIWVKSPAFSAGRDTVVIKKVGIGECVPQPKLGLPPGGIHLPRAMRE